MFKQQSHGSPGVRKKTSNKIIAGFAALVVTTFVAASSFAAATTNTKPTQADCAKAGYKNYGQCVKDWAHKKNPNKPGSGYGGGNSSVGTNIKLVLNNSNNNIIQVIVHVFN